MSLLDRRFSAIPNVSDRERYTEEVVGLISDLADYNNSTGKLAGGVKAELSDDGQYVDAWLNPHFYDPVKIRIYADGALHWCFADSFKEENSWNNIVSQNSVVTGAMPVINKHRQALFPDIEQIITYEM